LKFAPLSFPPILQAGLAVAAKLPQLFSINQPIVFGIIRSPFSNIRILCSLNLYHQ